MSGPQPPPAVPNLIPPSDASPSVPPGGQTERASAPLGPPSTLPLSFPSRRCTHFDSCPSYSCRHRRHRRQPEPSARGCRSQTDPPQTHSGTHRRMRTRHLENAAGLRGLPQAVLPAATQEHDARMEHGQRSADHGRPVRIFLCRRTVPVPGSNPEVSCDLTFTSRTGPGDPDWPAGGGGTLRSAKQSWPCSSPQLRAPCRLRSASVANMCGPGIRRV